ncbi:MAG: hypothetical protein FJX36_15465 [Alphaproteobacteria bacterium]|nr:hypothetical protein [Alphaproteobacteria bacterium]
MHKEGHFRRPAENLEAVALRALTHPRRFEQRHEAIGKKSSRYDRDLALLGIGKLRSEVQDCTRNACAYCDDLSLRHRPMQPLAPVSPDPRTPGSTLRAGLGCQSGKGA